MQLSGVVVSAYVTHLVDAVLTSFSSVVLAMITKKTNTLHVMEPSVKMVFRMNEAYRQTKPSETVAYWQKNSTVACGDDETSRNKGPLCSCEAVVE